MTKISYLCQGSLTGVRIDERAGTELEETIGLKGYRYNELPRYVLRMNIEKIAACRSKEGGSSGELSANLKGGDQRGQ